MSAVENLMLPTNRLAVIGCGNLNRSDDGVGVIVAQRLKQWLNDAPCDGVAVFDAGTGGMDVMFQARGATSLIIVETDDIEGFRRGRNLDKIGLHAQDTAELFFQDVKVPKANVLGEPGKVRCASVDRAPRLRFGQHGLAVDRLQQSGEGTIRIHVQRSLAMGPILCHPVHLGAARTCSGDHPSFKDCAARVEAGPRSGAGATRRRWGCKHGRRRT